jgi:hypothetical protein
MHPLVKCFPFVFTFSLSTVIIKLFVLCRIIMTNLTNHHQVSYKHWNTETFKFIAVFKTVTQ